MTDNIKLEKDRLKKILFKYKKKINDLEHVNKELVEKLKLISEKSDLTKKFLYKTVSTQTNLSFESEKLQFNNVSQRTKFQACNIYKLTELSHFFEKFKNGLISERDSDYYYDSKSNTYFIKSTGWYYYPVITFFLLKVLSKFKYFYRIMKHFLIQLINVITNTMIPLSK